MSRPKTGSVTDAVGENGTPFMYRRIVSHEPATAPAMPSAMRTENSATTQVPIGTMSGMSSDSNTNVGPDAVRAPYGPVPPRRALCSARRCASARRSVHVLSSPGRVGSAGGTRRPASHSVPSSTTSAIARPARNSPSCAPRRVDRTLTKPTDWYQMTSVQRSMPTLTSRMTSRMTMPTAARPRRRKMLPMEGGRAPSSGPPTGVPGSFGGRLPPEPWLLDVRGRGPPGRARGRIGVGSSPARASPSSSSRATSSSRSASSSATSSSPPTGRGASGPVRGARPSALARRRSSSRMNSSNRSPIAPHSGGRAGSRQAARHVQRRTDWRIGPGRGRPTGGGATRSTVGSPPGPAPRAGSAGAWRRARARTGTPSGSPAGSATAACRPRVGRPA